MGDALGDPEHMCASVFGQVGKARGMYVGHDVNVADVYGLNVHESGHKIVLPDKRGLRLTADDVTENAIIHIYTAIEHWFICTNKFTITSYFNRINFSNAVLAKVISLFY